LIYPPQAQLSGRPTEGPTTARNMSDNQTQRPFTSNQSHRVAAILKLNTALGSSIIIAGERVCVHAMISPLQTSIMSVMIPLGIGTHWRFVKHCGMDEQP
jgi:hypothetical protein